MEKCQTIVQIFGVYREEIVVFLLVLLSFFTWKNFVSLVTNTKKIENCRRCSYQHSTSYNNLPNLK